MVSTLLLADHGVVYAALNAHCRPERTTCWGGKRSVPHRETRRTSV